VGNYRDVEPTGSETLGEHINLIKRSVERCSLAVPSDGLNISSLTSNSEYSAIALSLAKCASASILPNRRPLPSEFDTHSERLSSVAHDTLCDPAMMSRAFPSSIWVRRIGRAGDFCPVHCDQRARMLWSAQPT